jgi:hypothetical protein
MGISSRIGLFPASLATSDSAWHEETADVADTSDEEGMEEEEEVKDGAEGETGLGGRTRWT